MGPRNPLTRSTPAPEHLLLKAWDDAALTVKGLATFPERDVAGDWVQPDGGTWDARPYANYEHEPEVIGTGTVEMVVVKHAGRDWNCPLWTTHFDRSSRLAHQVYRLSKEQVLTGLSMEFLPVGPLGGPYHKSFGHPSPVEDRDARWYSRWRGKGVAHCRKPVNFDARVLLPESERAGVEKAVRYAEVGRIGSEPLHELICKSLSRFAATVPRRAAVRGGWETKGMDGYGGGQAGGYQSPEAGYDQDPQQDQQQQPGGPKPGVRAFKNAAQGILDLCHQAEADIDQSDHTGAMAKMVECVKHLEEYAAELDQYADDLDDEIKGKMRRPDSEDGDDEDPDAEDDDGAGDESDDDADEPADGDETPLEPTKPESDDSDTDDDGPPAKPKGKKAPPFAKKAIRPPLLVDETGAIITKSYPNWSPRRFALADLRPVGGWDAAPAEPAADPELKAVEAEYAAAKRRLKRAERQARDLLRAAGSAD